MNAHKVLPPGLMEAATPGNRDGVGMAYGQAAEWLRNGDTPPPPLCAWLAERLDLVSKVLLAQQVEETVKPSGERVRKVRYVYEKPADDVMRALAVQKPQGQGRKPVDDGQRDRDQHLVWEVQSRHERDPNLKLSAIFHDVAATWPVPRDNVTAATVAEAWKRKRG